VRRPVCALAGVVIAALATACTAGSVRPSPVDGGARPAAALAATPPTTAPDCNATASLRPPSGPLPAPLQMPADSYMATIQKAGRLVAGVSADTLKLGSVNPKTGQFEGFDVDMAKAVARAIFGTDDAQHIVYRAVTNAQRIPDLQDGSVDLVAAAMTINCARRTMIDFSEVYYDAGQKVLVANKPGAATSINDLGGKKVCAAKGTTSLDNLSKVRPLPIPVGEVDVTDCLVDFQEGKVDAVSTDDTILAGMAAQDPYATVLPGRFTDEPYGIGVKLGHPEFTRFINGVLEQLRVGGADGGWAKSYDTWLKNSLGPGSQPAATYKD
jgi:polar amino acid transport system substrate-binding protein